MLEGITRQSVLDLAEEFGLPTELGNYPAADLLQADEVFITSTAGGIMPVVRVDDRILGNGVPGPLTMRLRDAYWNRRDQGWLGTSVSSVLEEA